MPEELEVEGDGEDDGDEGAEGGAEEGADRVEGREEDGDDEQDEDDGDADEGAKGGGDEMRSASCGGLGVMVVVVMMVMMVGGVQAAYDVGRGDEWAGVEGDLGQRDDGDEDAHEDGEGLWIARRLEDIGRNGILNAVAEHEDADDGQTGVEDVLRQRVSWSAAHSCGGQLTEKEKVALTPLFHL